MLLQDKIAIFTFNRNLPLAVLYLFFNTAGLPEGLLYTTLLTPVFLYLNIKTGYLKPLMWFVAVSGLYAMIHFIYGVHLFYYLRSWVMAFCNFSFCLLIFHFLRESKTIGSVFKVLVMLNGMLVLCALIFLGYRQGQNVFWYWVPFTPGVAPFPRLKLFSSEASIYSLMIAPLFLYYFMSGVKSGFKHVRLALLILGLSLLLSLSLGVLLSIFIAISISLLVHRKIYWTNKGIYRLAIVAVAILIIFGLFLFLNPDNVLSVRISNIYSGEDTSARGRTYEAFILAMRMLKEKSLAFGIGLGQIKVIGKPIVLDYYHYTLIPESTRIPNACAETLIYFGFTGLILRLGLQLYLFFRCKVSRNSFQLMAFTCIFIYQFTGSYITQIAEYVLWMLAFINCFPQFNISKQEELK
ncbi:MAG: O-antigen ligase family protein [Bacteroidia bacterium]|jgi:hypothetical protein